MTSSKKFNRLMSVLLLVCMLVSFAPTAYAEEATAENGLSAETTASADAVDTALTVEEEPVETEAPVIPEPPVAPGASSLNVTKYLFNIQCDTVHEHNYLCNWFGSNVVYNKDMQYDAERGVYTCSAYAKLATIVFSNIQRNYFGGMKHYWDNANPVIHLYYDPNATGLNSQGQEVTGLWLPDGEQVVHVYCYDKPAAPTNAAIEKLSSLKLLWLRDSDNTKNFLKPAKIIPGTYELGEMTGNSTDGFFCPLTITDIAPYIEAFNTKFPGEFPYMVDNDPEMPFPSLDFVLKYTGTTTDYKQDGTGWTLDASSYANNTEKLNGKTIWLARQDTLDYTVTYVDGVEEEELFADQSYTVKYGAETPAFVGTPTRANWVFTGWEPEVAETVTGDVTYTAQWEKATANKPSKKITDTDVKGMSVCARAEGTEPVNPFNEMYSTSPSVKNSGLSYEISEIYGNDVDGYFTDVTFHFVSGDAYEAYVSNVFNNLAPLKIPEYQGNWIYDFTSEYPADQVLNLKWFPGRFGFGGEWKTLDGGNIKANIANIIKVNVKLVKNTVTYTDGVEGVEVFEDQSYTVNNGNATPAFVGTPEREGYTFEGWDPEVAENVTEDVTYTAVWAAKEYTVPVDYNFDDGDEPEDRVFTYEDVIKDVTGTPERAGYTFTGWVDQNGEPVDAEATYTENIESLNATWAITEYVITVDPANGEEPYEMTITYEDVIGEAVKTPVYEGYTFTGWVDKYGEPVDSESNYYEPLDSLTATWKLTEYAVVIDPANGEEASVVTYTYKDVIGDKYDFSKEPERTGYTFEGWVDQDGNPVDLTATYTEDVQSITASWKGKTYTVTFKLKEDEGTLSFTSKKVVFGDPLGYTPKVEREGYTFIGWYDSTGKYYDSTSIYEVDGNLTLTGLWTVTIVPTGDSNNAALFALLMLASLACGGVTVLRLRKGKEEA